MELIQKLQLDESLKENIAAVSAGIHGNEKAYRQLYDEHRDHIGGFTGIWTFCVHAAECFTQAEHEIVTPDPDGWQDWISAIDDFVDALLQDPIGMGIRATAIERARTIIAARQTTQPTNQRRTPALRIVPIEHVKADRFNFVFSSIPRRARFALVKDNEIVRFASKQHVIERAKDEIERRSIIENA